MKKNKNINKIKNIIFCSAALLIFFSSFHSIFAQSGEDPLAGTSVNSVMQNQSGNGYQNQEKIPCSSNTAGCVPQTSDFITYLKSIISFGFAIIGILALFMLIIGAYQYLLAAGSGNAAGAKETITSALLGLILGLCAWIILSKINPDLVNFRAIPQITGGGGGMVNPGQNAVVGGTVGAGGGTAIPTTYTSNAPADIQQKAKDYAAQNGVPEAVAMNMLSTESGGVNGLTSSKGAAGLLQLMPGTAQGLGVTDPMNVDQNLNAGYKYADQLYNKYGDWGQAMAAYNMGPTAFDSYMAGNRSMPQETINYVNKTMGSCNFCPSK